MACFGNYAGRWLTLLLGLGVTGCFGEGAPDGDRLGAGSGEAVGQPPPIHASPTAQGSVAPADLPKSPFCFENVAEASGIQFQHHSPFTEERHVHLVMGSGVGWVDFDRDGWPDLYCCQGATYRGGDSQIDDSPTAAPSNLLFQNRQDGSFADITEKTGLFDGRYSMGVAVADYDNDGFPDLCVTAYEENSLYHNNGDGTFHRVELPRHSLAGRFSAGCAWADVDADGNLDLFIVNYARLDPRDYPTCKDSDGKDIYLVCHPSQFERMPDLLYQNCGDGRFSDISEQAGISGDEGRQGLGVAAADLDQDGDIDFYVSNDTTPNQLWENQGDGKFVDRGEFSGAAVNGMGAREAGMGIAVGDVDGDCLLDLLVTNYYNETNTLYRNEGSLAFFDVTDQMGLGAPSRLRLTFSPLLIDFDHDGWLDVFVASGHLQDRLAQINRSEAYAQLAQVFHNEKGVRFSDVSAGSGRYFLEPRVARAAAAADYDRDGDADIAVNHLNGTAALLRNDTDSNGSWLQIELVGIESNRGGVGAVIRIDLGQQVLVRSRQANVGYLSCDEGRVFVGLGESEEVGRLSIRWPGGHEECWENLPINSFHRFVEGTGNKIVKTREVEDRG